jgi:hypothetical protein
MRRSAVLIEASQLNRVAEPLDDVSEVPAELLGARGLSILL